MSREVARSLAGQCLGKHPFPDRPTAEKAAKRAQRSSPSVKVYRCPHCSAFHIGALRREPSGRLSRRREHVRERQEMTEAEAKSVVIAARIRHGIPEHLADLSDAGRPNAGTLHGRLRLRGMADDHRGGGDTRGDPSGLSADQYAAAEWYLGARMRWLRAIGAPGRPHEPHEAAGGQGGVLLREAIEAWQQVIDVLREASVVSRSPIMAAMDVILVRQQMAEHMVGDLRIGLNAIYRAFLAGRR